MVKVKDVSDLKKYDHIQIFQAEKQNQVHKQTKPY